VSFSGRFDAELLRRVGASQPDTEEPSKQRELTREAQKLRDRLRWAERLLGSKTAGRRVFTHQEKEVLADLESGALRRRANDATERSGFGRIKNDDGTSQDIGPNTGGLTRRILDNSTPCETTLTQVEADQSDHPWSLLEEERAPTHWDCWD